MHITSARLIYSWLLARVVELGLSVSSIVAAVAGPLRYAPLLPENTGPGGPRQTPNSKLELSPTTSRRWSQTSAHVVNKALDAK